MTDDQRRRQARSLEAEVDQKLITYSKCIASHPFSVSEAEFLERELDGALKRVSTTPAEYRGANWAAYGSS